VSPIASYAINTLIVLAWLGMPFLLSLLLGKTIWRMTVFDRKTDPAGYWRAVRLWGGGWALVSIFMLGAVALTAFGVLPISR
jgi:hypothetical protein